MHDESRPKLLLTVLVLATAFLLSVQIPRMGDAETSGSGSLSHAAEAGARSHARLAGAGQVLSNFDVANESGLMATGFEFGFSSAMTSFSLIKYYNDQNVANPLTKTITSSGSVQWSAMSVPPDEVAHFGYTVQTADGVGQCPTPIVVESIWHPIRGNPYTMPNTQLDWCGGTAPTPIPAPGRDGVMHSLQQAGRYTPTIDNNSGDTFLVQRFTYETPDEIDLPDLTRQGAAWVRRQPIDQTPIDFPAGQRLQLSRPLVPVNQRWLVFMYELSRQQGSPVFTAFQAIWVYPERATPTPEPTWYLQFPLAISLYRLRE